MEGNQRYTQYQYLPKEDYDRKVRINNEDVGVYSDSKLKERYPNGSYPIVGETFEKNKNDRNKNIGSIELADRKLYVSSAGQHSKFFRKSAGYVEVEEGGFISLLKMRLMPFILLLAMVAAIAGIIFYLNRTPEKGVGEEVNITPVETDLTTIGGTVYKELIGVEGATVSLQLGSTEVATARTDAEGHYLISDVANGCYNLVATYGDSILTKIAYVDSMSVTVDFYFPGDELKDIPEIPDVTRIDEIPESASSKGDTKVRAIVSINGDETPDVAVGRFEIEALLHMIVDHEVNLAYHASLLAVEKVPAEALAAIQAVCGELDMSYYDFYVEKQVKKDGKVIGKDHLYETKEVIEIAIPYDSSIAIGTYVFRFEDGKGVRFEQLSERPSSDYKDGTYYVNSKYIFIYTNKCSTFGIGKVEDDQVSSGSDTITYSGEAKVNLATGEISMMYKHDPESTNSSRLEIYLVGDNGDLKIAESGVIPPGNGLETMSLLKDIKGMPSVGTYNGIMKIIYLDSNNEETDTVVDIPLSVAITQ